MPRAEMTSERLRYRPICAGELEAFHRLVTDEHVCRYLMDGRILPRDWSRDRIRDSEALFARRGIGIWLAREQTTNALVGFCGFLEDADHPEPQLLYALFGHFAGRGYGTEMARAAIARARACPGIDEIVATVDEINDSSRHILEKLGFTRIATSDGAFGDVLFCSLHVT